MAKSNQVSVAQRGAVLALLLNLAVFSFVPSALSAAQQSTQVGAIICHSESPDLQISEPLSDSVTGTPTIPIEGTALYTSQIDILVNGQYSHSVAIGFDSVLQTDVSLQEGTNTITLQAYFSCNNTSADLDIIVDYQPAVTPTTPGNIDTQVSSSSGSSIVSSSQESTSGIAQIFENVKEKLGLEDSSDSEESPSQQSYVTSAFNWMVFLAILVLVGMIFAPAAIIEKVVAIFALQQNSIIKHPHRFVRFLIVFFALLLATFFVMS